MPCLACNGEGNGNPLQCSCLENPRDGRTWWAAVYGVTQSWTRLKQLSSSSSSKAFEGLPMWCSGKESAGQDKRCSFYPWAGKIPWRRKWQPTPVSWILQWRILGTDEPAAAAKLLQSCPTLCDPIGGSPPGSPVPGILQAGTLEWVAISFSNA